jgi:hypothetical protein
MAETTGLIFPAAYEASSPSDPNMLTYDQAMAESEDQRVQWIEAMKIEIHELESHGTWDEVPITDAKTKITPGTWVFRRKRTPDGEIRKSKARYCCRGDLEEGDFETYAPVVAWSFGHLFLLVLLMALGWTTCSIDFSNAFVQARLRKIQCGYTSHTVGQPHTHGRLAFVLIAASTVCPSPLLWHEHLGKALAEMGLTASKHDPCLLYTANLLVVLYVDDAGIAALDLKYIDEFITELHCRKFDLTKEGSFSEFLGIKFDEDTKKGTITLTQRDLIKKVITPTGLDECKPNWTPASTLALRMDPDGPPMQETWSYPSIIGMLLYLATNTRPDTSFAVSQVARFNHNPKQSHAQAIKIIVRYLHRTLEMGKLVKPTRTLALDCYVDADFAGRFRCDPDSEPSSVKSRTEYIITLGGAPLIWKSQLQSAILLLTQEAEYFALSQSLRTLLPLHLLLLEVTAASGVPDTICSTIHARAFEDNQGAFLLATAQPNTNRTKYYAVKFHHFWGHVKDGLVEVFKVDTTLQRADGHTKGLVCEVFKRIRKLNQGW